MIFLDKNSLKPSILSRWKWVARIPTTFLRINALLVHQKLPFLKEIQIVAFENQGLMQSHQFKSQPDEDDLPVK